MSNVLFTYSYREAGKGGWSFIEILPPQVGQYLATSITAATTTHQHRGRLDSLTEIVYGQASYYATNSRSQGKSLITWIQQILKLPEWLRLLLQKSAGDRQPVWSEVRQETVCR